MGAVISLIGLGANLYHTFVRKPEQLNKTMKQIEDHVERQKREAVQLNEAQAEVALNEARNNEAAARAEAERANDALLRGIRPVVMPTEKQYHDARRRIQYDPEKLHFAVCGTAGSGKSSLINAFRGLTNTDARSAAVGETETTLKITRYPDPRPHSRFVWYDIPGAGTLSVPDWQYFNDQGLFVFDFIVMVYDVRFTKIDIGIIENCNRFEIPVFVVRSKADQHIANKVQSESAAVPGDEDYNEIFQQKKDRYIEATNSDFDRHMEAMAAGEEVKKREREMLLNQRVYIVSSSILRGLLSSDVGRPVNESRFIDEKELVKNMMRAAERRRYYYETAIPRTRMAE